MDTGLYVVQRSEPKAAGKGRVFVLLSDCFKLDTEAMIDYKVIYINCHKSSYVEDQVNACAKDGWELVSTEFLANMGGIMALFFKREKVK